MRQFSGKWDGFYGNLNLLCPLYKMALQNKQCFAVMSSTMPPKKTHLDVKHYFHFLQIVYELPFKITLKKQSFVALLEDRRVGSARERDSDQYFLHDS